MNKNKSSSEDLEKDNIAPSIPTENICDGLSLKDHDAVNEEKELEEDLVYNLPVSPNPFKVLGDEKDSLNEINNNSTDVCEAFEQEEKTKPLEQKKNYMSSEQEKVFLKQFEKIMTEAFSTNKNVEPT